MKYLRYATLFIAGILVGVLIMGYLSARAYKVSVECIRISYYVEQEKLAAIAHKDGDKYAEFIYRTNIADSSHMGKLKTFEDMKTAWTLSFPFAPLVMERIIKIPNQEKADRIDYAMNLGRLAEATENIGLTEEAAKEWDESTKLMEWNDINRMRSFVNRAHENDKIWITK